MKNKKDNNESIENNPISLPKEQVDSVMGLYSNGKITEAIDMIKALNEDYPNVPLLFNLLGACYNKLGQFDPAAQFFETAISLKDSEKIPVLKVVPPISIATIYFNYASK